MLNEGWAGRRPQHHESCVYYNQYDSYPSVFGIEVLHEIPRNISKEEFEEWVKETREMYAQRDSQDLTEPDSTYYVSDKQPENGIIVEWVYEIDLDNLVFHVDSQPLFRLDNLPADDVFLKAISFDHFGHRALYEHTNITRPVSLRLACTTAITPSRVISRLQSL